MDEYKKRLACLLHCKQMSWKNVKLILQADPTLTTFSFKPENPLSKKFPAVTMHQLPIEQILEQYQRNGIHLISLLDDEYPEILKSIYQPPWMLFAKGDIRLLKSVFPLAVVGSREASDYGKQAIGALFPQLIDSGAVIISGLAKGIDTYAHQMAIRNGGSTIGVIAGGFEHIYPKENLGLAQYMMNHHLLLSEYPPYTRPERWHFPMRNRIISGLAKGTLVVEAKKRSGSFITADFALNEGREVFAIPGSIFEPKSAGTNELIQMGAKLVKEPKDIIEEIIF
ncbi:DNA processing protein DprA [Mesobacillus campisalis]|uniref:DNA processing protein DprA n=1 Tax=Mesobacillus campisalis TaxID=1408103 RepID=A0A0M2T2U1_9BACI|nr:DNA-processing protein DprA [Mesobacillus campisalis]KKK39582.1 DNA processing protein DprA [Mesobacillus campisalis]